ncbi:hypothetical protein Tco_0345693 [Tanacetum coccineum]
MRESTKRHEENSNLIKEIRASTDAAIRNQGNFGNPSRANEQGDNVGGRGHVDVNVPIFVGTFSVVTDFVVLENIDAYRDEGMSDVIFGKLFLREVGIKARRKRISDKKTKNKAKNDKTEHGMEKCEKTKSNRSQNDTLREKLLNVNLLIAKIDALRDNPTPSSDIVTKKISSGSPTTRSDLSLLDYKVFYVDNDHFKEKSSGSTTTHADFSQYDLFIFDLSNDHFPPTDKSDLYHEEFVDELTHIMSLPKS